MQEPGLPLVGQPLRYQFPNLVPRLTSFPHLPLSRPIFFTGTAFPSGIMLRPINFTILDNSTIFISPGNWTYYTLTSTFLFYHCVRGFLWLIGGTGKIEFEGGRLLFYYNIPQAEDMTQWFPLFQRSWFSWRQLPQILMVSQLMCKRKQCWKKMLF